MAIKQTERSRVLGYFIKADLKEADALLEDVKLILRNRQPKATRKVRTLKGVEKTAEQA